MKTHLNFIVSILITATAFAQNPQDGKATTEQEHAVDQGLDIKSLCQHWVHSREEQADQNAKEQIFRPAESREFPASRFRGAYKFSQNGECESIRLDAADAHHFSPAKWEIDAADKTLLKITSEGKTLTFRIVELTKDILRLAPVETKE